MLLNNIKDGMEYRYYDISFNGSKWIAWFNKIMPITELAPNGLLPRSNK